MAGNKDSGSEGGDKVNAGKEKEIKEAIRVTNEQIKLVDEQTKKTNKLKIETYWEVGNRITALVGDMSGKEKKELVSRFVEGTEMGNDFYYLSVKFAQVFTEEQYKKAVDNGMTVRVMKALVGDKNLDDKKRAQLIQQVITKGLKEDDIRSIRGTKGTRRAANAGKRQDAAKKQPPRRVFTTALDRALLLQESVGFATDAVGRMSEMNDTELAETTKVLTKLRSTMEDVDDVINSFIKYTNNVSKSKKNGGSK